MENERLWATTIDNPFDPFKDFDDWYRFDEDHGYHTCEYIARVAEVPFEATESEYSQAINAAVKDIVRLNVIGLYRTAR